MKKKNLITLVVLLSIVFLFNSCASSVPTKQARTIEEAYPSRMENTIIGMSLENFKQIWTEAKRVGLSEDGEIYEFVYKRITMGNDFDYVITHFYFKDNKLIKYARG